MLCTIHITFYNFVPSDLQVRALSVTNTLKFTSLAFVLKEAQKYSQFQNYKNFYVIRELKRRPKKLGMFLGYKFVLRINILKNFIKQLPMYIQHVKNL